LPKVSSHPCVAVKSDLIRLSLDLNGHATVFDSRGTADFFTAFVQFYPGRVCSGRHAGIHGTYFSAFGLVKVTFALHACVGVDYIDIPFRDGAYRTFRHADSTCYTIIGNR